MRRRPSNAEEEDEEGDSSDAPISDPTVVEWNESAGVSRRAMHNVSLSGRRRPRLQSPWFCSFSSLVVTLLSSITFFACIYSFLSRQTDPAGCRMSYMRPAFAKLTEFDTEHTRFASKYSIYLYREGGLDEDTRVRLAGSIPNILPPKAHALL